jgi:transcriptional regulator with XRE-family HTH domain
VVVRLDSARRVFESDAQVARALGVNPAQVSRWRHGQAPDPLNRDRLTALDGVIEMLSDYLTPGRIRKWLGGANANLGDRTPLQALRQGNLPGVLAAVHVLKSGAYA